MLPKDLFQVGSQSEITYTKLLSLEGMSSCQFFKALLHEMNLLTEIEIRNFGGVDQLPGPI